MRAFLLRAVALLALVAVLPWAASAQTLPGNLPLRRDAQPGSEGPWLPALVLLGLAAAAGGYIAWRRGGLTRGRTTRAHRAEHTLTRLSSHALTPHASVHAVQWNGEEYLLGCTAQQVTLLARRTPAPGEERP